MPHCEIKGLQFDSAWGSSKIVALGKMLTRRSTGEKLASCDSWIKWIIISFTSWDHLQAYVTSGSQ